MLGCFLLIFWPQIIKILMENVETDVQNTATIVRYESAFRAE